MSEQRVLPSGRALGVAREDRHEPSAPGGASVTAEALGLGVVAVIVLGGSLGVVLARNLFHSVLWLALALVGTALLFLLLHAEFLAAVQVLLYAGGVVTIVVFAIMLTERLAGESIRQMNRGITAGLVAAVVVFVALAGTILRAGRTGAPAAAGPTTVGLGRAVLTDWVLAFEALALLLVAALVGALYLARTEE
jgi:NADH-quinone oxidoreductase subunit J